ncbi:5-carboxymethyl-2-hydroxymuconate isomerase [Mesorhizobium shonense]|uniref:5-carboxymethyl-2-hydroxymuconate isomerase n=1 Tax=Mesorhizobium shonense TaxID=1209948 RepID=A0ABV2I2L5_9HYPH|nr:5-carboxymethyl-2-hydroxymuconate Delta-isomerase [Mesorhizobium sp.]TIS49191.1 MAG: 5-carboxymethyl-2-hydroxymuconate Delta-isomerase [Mesorhizobium sp.]
MPHIIIDYSRGASEVVDLEALARAVHREVRDGGLVKPTAVRTLAREATVSLVADEHPQNHFIQIIVRMAPGREPEVKKQLLQRVFEAARGVAAVALTDGRIGLRADLYESNPEFAISASSIP